MILAAGYGTRLRPYSLLRPKPLFPVLGKSLLLHTIDRLKQCGFGPIIVNCHYLREQIVDLLHKDKDIILQIEKYELGTGGGLRKALKNFDDQPLLVTNGDIYHSIDYNEVYTRHLALKPAVSMVMHDYPRFNKVLVDGNQKVVSFQTDTSIHSKKSDNSESEQVLAFTGVHVVDPHVLELIPTGTFYNIIDLYRNLLNLQRTIAAFIVRDHSWFDIGTPNDYLELHASLVKKMKTKNKLIAVNAHGFFIHQSTSYADNVKFNDWGFVGKGVSIGSNVRLERVVVWNDANIEDGSYLKDCIVTG